MLEAAAAAAAAACRRCRVVSPRCCASAASTDPHPPHPPPFHPTRAHMTSPFAVEAHQRLDGGTARNVAPHLLHLRRRPVSSGHCDEPCRCGTSPSPALAKARTARHPLPPGSVKRRRWAGAQPRRLGRPNQRKRQRTSLSRSALAGAMRSSRAANAPLEPSVTWQSSQRTGQRASQRSSKRAREPSVTWH